MKLPRWSRTVLRRKYCKYTQARTEKMKWGVFCKKVENGWGFVKRWTFPQRRVHYVQYHYFFYFTFYLFGGVYAPNASPLPTQLYFTTKCDSKKKQNKKDLTKLN